MKQSKESKEEMHPDSEQPQGEAGGAALLGAISRGG